MKKAILGIIAITAAMLASPAIAQSRDTSANWLVRARAVHIDPSDKSSPVAGSGAADRIGVESRTIPELDIAYFFTPHFAAELVLTWPQKHEVYLDGQAIGTFRHLPPTLLAQYHFTPDSTVSPYVGLGLNWTTFSKNRLLDGQGSLEHDSIGLAAQAGIDFKLDRNWSLNVDVKKVRLRSDVLIGGVKASKVKVDPVLFGAGIGYRF
ncbi:OmpW/AlkL family protein [Pseudoduganella albidiflava]|uniref:OmpW family protein n=1 Tax=Pseudoduganella albidiflava TaxID=321983 RepID=A0A411X6K3_9BURK|nr:OmpW family outer membrane protein [Pseudoduganella albidiflava]QBI04661.1 OmpW family protein [Pseudoduganella albidiflava]GGY29031.1 outer membrane protein [Pseudoduganella albidiflava]